MGYTDKQDTDAVRPPFSVCMTQRTRVNDVDSAAESKFYIPAGATSSLVAGRLEWLWTALFNHRV